MENKLNNKDRVVKLGEVFTPEYIVKDMLDEISELHYSSRIFEPGCGNGNFLIQILERKLYSLIKLKEIKESIKTNNLDEFHYKIFIVVSSIYSVEIDSQNREEAIKRLESKISDFYIETIKKEIPDFLRNLLKKILYKNIVLGDLINKTSEIYFFEYSQIPGFKVKIRKFKFKDLLHPDDEVFEDELKLFGHVPKAIEELEIIKYTEIEKRI